MAHEWWGYWDCIYPSLVYVSLKEFGVVGLDIYTWRIKDLHKCWLVSLAKRRLCLGPTGVINCTALSALSFWVSLFPETHGYNCSTPGFPVHHQFLELTQTHAHPVSDVIWSSHPLLSSSPPAFNLSQHPGLFWWISSSHQVAKLLEFQPQHQSFQWIFRTDFL